MKIFDRFLLRSFIGPLFLTIFIVLFVLVLQFLWVYIDDLVGKGLGFKVIAEFLFWGSCTVIPMALPLATLLASIMTMGNLGEFNELLAMKAAGISLQRIMRPLIVASVFISIACFFSSNNLMPLAYKNIFALRDDISRTKDQIRIPTGLFYDGIDNYVLRVESRNHETDMLYDIMVYDHTAKRGNNNITLADSGSIKLTEDKANALFTLYSGETYDQGERQSTTDTNYTMQRVQFDRQEIIIELNNYAFQRRDGDRFGNDVMAQGIGSLTHRRDSLDSLYSNARKMFYGRLMLMGGFNYTSQFDSTYKKQPTQTFPLDSLTPFGLDYSYTQALGRAASNVDRTVSQIDAFMVEEIQIHTPLRRTKIEWFRKFTVALACFIFFFIGAPLGAILRKGGFGTPVIVSMLFFVVYYVIDISGKKLATDGATSAAMGTLISSAVLLPIGIYLTWKATTDAPLINKDLFFKTFDHIKRALFQILPKKRSASNNNSVENLLTQAPSNARIVFMGTPDFAAGVLDYLLKAHYNVCGVVTVPDKTSGRGLKNRPSAVKECALAHDLPLLQPERLKDPDFMNRLAAWHADLFVVVAFRMLPDIIWQIPPKGCFNLHASLLPQYRGAAPLNHVLINGETQTGLTTFLIDSQIDTGQILLQETVDILPSDNVGTLHDRMMASGGPLVAATINGLTNGTLIPKRQPHVAHDALKPAPKLTKTTGLIDWNSPAAQIVNLVRGLSPTPGAYALLRGEDTTAAAGAAATTPASTAATPAGPSAAVDSAAATPTKCLKIFAAAQVTPQTNDSAASPNNAPLTPGSIVTDGKTYLHVACADGFVAILELQAPSKKRMGVAAYLAGQRHLDAFV